VPRCPYDAAFLANQRARLEAIRSRLSSEVDREREGVASWHEDMEGYDQHPADDATATEAMEIDLALLDNAEAQLTAVEDALRALDRDEYGWDDEAGEWIPAARLEALPWARRTIESQRRIEAKHQFDESGYHHDDDVTSL
jgi:RNA polymerase-binding transcription factor DksA